MSAIDDIMLKPAYWKSDDYEEAKQELREVLVQGFKGVIGKYETVSFRSKDIDALIRDRLRAEQHQRLNDWLDGLFQ